MAMMGTSAAAEDVKEGAEVDLEERTARFGEGVIAFAKNSTKSGNSASHQPACAFWYQRRGSVLRSERCRFKGFP
jgi:hypothetical protein